jgi:hypothetical protein
MGILTWIFRPSGLTHGGPPFLLSKSSQSGTHGTKPHQKSLSARQVNLGLENPKLPCFGEVAECSILFRIIG